MSDPSRELNPKGNGEGAGFRILLKMQLTLYRWRLGFPWSGAFNGSHHLLGKFNFQGFAQVTLSPDISPLSLTLSPHSFSESDSDFKVHFQVFLTKLSSLEFTLHSLTKYLLAHFVCYTLGWVPRIYPFHKHYWAYTLCEPLFKWLGLQW